MVIVLFYIHPNIVQYTFNNFKCYNVDSEERVYADLAIMCWSDYHKAFSFYVGVPSLVIWGLGIPGFGLLLMSRVRKNLDSLDAK